MVRKALRTMTGGGGGGRGREPPGQKIGEEQGTDEQDCDIAYLLFECVEFSLTLDTIGILCSVYSIKEYPKSAQKIIACRRQILFHKHFNKLSIKHKSYSKLRKKDRRIKKKKCHSPADGGRGIEKKE